jgi:hypothetical protein
MDTLTKCPHPTFPREQGKGVDRIIRIHTTQRFGLCTNLGSFVNPPYFFSLIGVYRRSSAALLFCLCVAAAYGQAIRIPDFRDTTPVVLKPGEVCDKCGVIRSIREVQVGRPVPVPEAFRTNPEGGLGSDIYVGAVVALPLAEKGEQPGKPFVGGVGTPEMRARFSESTYEITIRLDDGGYTQVTRRDGASYRIGDRVRVSGTQLELIAP